MVARCVADLAVFAAFAFCRDGLLLSNPEFKPRGAIR